jgi:hypothetical protein
VLAKSSAPKERDEDRLEKKRKREQIKTKKLARDFDAIGTNGTSVMLESKLRRIATRGAVTLFNAVRKQQKEEDAPRGSGGSTGIGGKDVKAMDKKDFLGMLSKKAKTDGAPSNKVAAAAAAVKVAASGDEDEDAGAGKQGWSVLQEGYMLGSKADDWDKAGSDEDEESESEIDDRADVDED